MMSAVLIPTELRRLNSLIYMLKEANEDSKDLSNSLIHIYYKLDEIANATEDWELKIRQENRSKKQQ